MRKGMMKGSGKRGYHNIIGKDPMVHSQSAKGIKQPQKGLMSIDSYKKNISELSPYDKAEMGMEYSRIMVNILQKQESQIKNELRMLQYSDKLSLRQKTLIKDVLLDELSKIENKLTEMNKIYFKSRSIVKKDKPSSMTHSRGKGMVYLEDVKKKIGTAEGDAEYIGTELEDDQGNWYDDYAVKDGYYVIHGDNRHHVYKLKPKEMGQSSKKYIKRSDSIDRDYQYYLAQEGLYHTFFGHKLTPEQQQKRDYIWKTLLKEHKVTK